MTGLDQLVLAVASRLIANQDARTPQTNWLCKTLAIYGRTACVHNGERHAAFDPELPAKGFPSGKTALAAVGIEDGKALHASFESMRDEHGCFAAYEADFAESFIPARVLAVIGQAILDGPGVVQARSKVVLRKMAASDARVTRRKGGGPYAGSSVRVGARWLTALSTEIAALRADGYPHAALEPWDVAKHIAPPNKPARGWEVSAPSPTVAREALAALAAQIQDALGVSSGGTHPLSDEALQRELARARTMAKETLRSSGVVLLLKERMILLLLLATGGRADACSRLDVGNLLFPKKRIGPAPDFRESSGIWLYPEKHLAADDARFKALPLGACLMIEAYLTCLDRLRPKELQRTEHDPLIQKSVKSKQRVDPDTIGRWVAGKSPRAIAWAPKYDAWVPWGGRKAAIPRLDPPPAAFVDKYVARYEHKDELPAKVHVDYAEYVARFSDDPPALQVGDFRRIWLHPDATPMVPTRSMVEDLLRLTRGHTAQEIRHLSFQLAMTAGALWNEHWRSAVEPPHQPETYAHAIADHKNLSDDTLVGVYGDLNRPEAYEVLSGRAIEIMWPLISTDLGETRGPDLPTIEQKLAELRNVNDQLDGLVADARTHLQSPAPIAPVGAMLTDSEKLDLLIGQVAGLREMVRSAAAATIHAVGLSAEQATLTGTIAELKHDPARWVATNERGPIDWREVEKRALGHGLLEEDPVRHVRDWLTVRELAELLEVDVDTVNRWLRGDLPSNPSKRLWEADAIPVAGEGSFRRIWVPALNPYIMRRKALDERLSDFLVRWPKSQLWTNRDGSPKARCAEPLKLPKAHEDDYRRFHESSIDPTEAAEPIASASRALGSRSSLRNAA